MLVALLVGAFLAMPRTWMIYGYGLPKAPVVFIGTSLLAHGMPPTGRGLLGDDQTYARVAVGGMNEDMEIEFADLVISQDRAKVIVLEIYPFMREFVGDQSGLADPVLLNRIFAHVQVFASRLKARIAIAVSFLTGMQSSSGVLGEVPDAPARAVQESDLRERFPMLLRDPLYPDRIREMVSRAAAKGIAVYLVAPPQRQSVADYIGAHEAARFDDHMKKTAAEIGLPLLYSGGTWPNELFVDVAHLNRAGRARFMSELARAWTSSHDR